MGYLEEFHKPTLPSVSFGRGKPFGRFSRVFFFPNSEIYKLVKPARVTVERNLLFVFPMKPVRVGKRQKGRTLK